MAKTEQRFGSRLARLLGASSNEVTESLRPVATTTDRAFDPYSAPQLQLSADPPAKATAPEPETVLSVSADQRPKDSHAAPGNDLDRQSAVGTDMGMPTAVANKRNSPVAPERLLPTEQQKGGEIQDQATLERAATAGVNRYGVEQAVPEVAGIVFSEEIDSAAVLPTSSYWRQKRPSDERPLVNQELAQELQSRRERTSVSYTELHPDARRVQNEKLRPSTAQSVELDQPVQEVSLHTLDRQGSWKETAINATPSPQKKTVAPVIAPLAVSPAKVVGTAAQPNMASLDVSDGTQSKQSKTSTRGRLAQTSVKIEIGEVLISVRPTDVRPKHSALPVLRRTPRAHTIPLSGLGED